MDPTFFSPKQQKNLLCNAHRKPRKHKQNPTSKDDGSSMSNTSRHFAMDVHTAIRMTLPQISMTQTQAVAPYQQGYFSCQQNLDKASSCSYSSPQIFSVQVLLVEISCLK
jgi:hypothetical protein